ncbi:MAG TPA: hypothetical protein VFX16_18065 [Pseudonocardiaceae bacterium]|nr:hypothetical protein [Pseudonocardiaceae bacterium]
MSSPPPRPTRSWRTVVGWTAAVVACGACCAGPLLGASGGLAALFAVAAIWVPALAGLAVAAPLVGYLVHRRRRAAARRAAQRPVDLGVPDVRRG